MTNAHRKTPAEKISSVKKGNDFRDAVAAFLRTRYEDVMVEKEICGKVIDIIYKERHFTKYRTIGVECKNYGTALTATEFTNNIYFHYKESLELRELDDVLIVGTRNLGEAAYKRIYSSRGFSYVTYEELEESLIDLRVYISGLSELFRADGLQSYYVETRFDGSDGHSALEEIRQWIEQSNTLPLAILGGYGQGKTSFAKRLVALQAEDYLKDPTRRIPILIRLGQVVHETTLEGLFGREFTARVKTNYNFETFRHLNENGRLLIVLDGFDEMKHGMSAADFKANFSEFSRLLTPRSKVILLGRPNAFPSDDTRTYVLRGKKKALGSHIDDPNAAQWQERRISKFSSTETCYFLKNYLLHLIEKKKGFDGVLSELDLDARIKEVLGEVDEELLRRPVHARLVAELALTPTFSFKGFREYDLYAQFINHLLTELLSRDTDHKRARRKIGLQDRMRFQERLAHWAWSRPNKTQGSFLRDEIPPRLLSGLDDGDTTNDEEKFSEYIVSSVTDEKESGYLYFTHRSFQEFLVAEFIRKQAATIIQHEIQSSIIDEAIVSFLLGAPSQEFIDAWYDSLPLSRAEFSSLYLSLFSTRATIVQSIYSSVESSRTRSVPASTGLSPAQVGILALAVTRGHCSSITVDRLWSSLTYIVATDPRDSASVAFHFLLTIVSEKQQAADLLALALEDRPTTVLNGLRRQDPRASRFALSDDATLESVLSSIELTTKGRRNILRWNIRENFEALMRLIHGPRGAGLLLEGSRPPNFNEQNSGVLEFSRTEFDAFHTPITFRDIEQIVRKERDPRVLAR